jgi:hypothetical protein
LTRLSHILPARVARPGVFGALVLASVLAVTGCGAGSTSSGSSSSGTSGSSPGSGTSQSSFRQCLQKHGVTLPPGGPFGGGGIPRPRPTGSAASAFRQAIQACGGGGFPGRFGSSG